MVKSCIYAEKEYPFEEDLFGRRIMDNNVKLVPAKCTQCGGTVEVNKDEETATCPFCGATFVIEKAVNNYNVNIDAKGAVKEVLDFVGDQMNESRQERRRIREEEAENFKTFKAGSLKIFVVMFACMTAAMVIIMLVLHFTDGFGNDSKAADTETDSESVIECYVEDGCLYTDITGPQAGLWAFQENYSTGTVLERESNDTDGYHSCVAADDNTDGIYFVVAAGFGYDADSDPQYYSVNRITIENSSIVETEDAVIVYDLKDYDFE